MTKRFTLGGALVLAVMSTASTGIARADGIDPIATRQAAFDLNNGDFAYIRSVVAAKGDVKPLEVPAKAIAKWAAVIPTMFPAGSDKGETKALPAIWSDQAGFQKIATGLGEAATKLATDAKAGDADLVAADAKALGEQCGACHKTYRAK
jgi:cytochrome c556